MVSVSNYSIFIVEQRRSDSSAYSGLNPILAGTSASTSSNLYVGYRSNTVFTVDHQGISQLNYAVSGYSTPTPAMHTVTFSATVGKKYWSNGGVTADLTNSATSSLVAYPGATIGFYAGGRYYDGDIAEIIIFTRVLTTEERQAIESYLSQKYNIQITG